MSPQPYPSLFTPFDIGPCRVKNRLVWTAHDTNMADSRHRVSAEQAAYFEARAAGGAGLIVMEASSVHPTAEIHGTSVHAYDPDVVEGYRDLTWRVHRHGAVMLVQLAHQGVHMNFHKNWTSGWGPSLVPSVTERESPHVLEPAEIAELVRAYAVSAGNAIDGGMDGVEVSAAHSYLPAQFLSPYYNRRTDSYGGTLENRFRFLREVIERVRDTIGDRKVLGIRLSGDELTSFGMTTDDAVEIARMLERTGSVDYLSVSVGSMHTRHLIVPPMTVAQGYQMPITTRIKHETRLPVVAVGRITDPTMADQIVESGNADLVAMTRAQIADPELGVKAASGRSAEIRPCIGCNQGCRERFFLGKSITCTVNPYAGREHRSASWQPSPPVQRATVVGGGPAGLQAAVTLAEREVLVDLFEAEDRLGGQILLAAQLPSRSEIADIVRYLERRCRNLGVRIHLGETWRPDGPMAEAAELTVLATGSRPRRPPFPEYPVSGEISGIADVPAWTVWDVVQDVPMGDHVVVVDERGRYEGLGVAELVASRGHKVSVVSSMDVVGQQLKATGDHPLILSRLLTAGVTVHPSQALAEVSSERTLLRSSYAADRETVLGPASDVVFVCGNEPVSPGSEASLGLPGTVVYVGDCHAPRGLDEAIYEGARVAFEPERVSRLRDHHAQPIEAR